MAERRRAGTSKSERAGDERTGPIGTYRVAECAALAGGTADDPLTYYTLILTDVDGDRDAGGRLTAVLPGGPDRITQGATVVLTVVEGTTPGEQSGGA